MYKKKSRGFASMFYALIPALDMKGSSDTKKQLLVSVLCSFSTLLFLGLVFFIHCDHFHVHTAILRTWSPCTRAPMSVCAHCLHPHMNLSILPDGFDYLHMCASPITLIVIYVHTQFIIFAKHDYTDEYTHCASLQMFICALVHMLV